MTVNRYYSSTAVATTLTSGVTDSATTLPVAVTTGLPGSFPYTVILERDTSNEELVTVTAASGLNLTVTRGVDGSTAIAHSLGATVEHGVSARDFREPQEHIDATAAHGVAGDVVGTSDTQTLTNKTLTAPTIADFTNAAHTHTAAASGGTGIPQASVTGLTAALALLAATSDLAAHEADTSTHGVSVAIVGTTETQTLTNKTLTAPTIDDFTNAAHNHASAGQEGGHVALPYEIDNVHGSASASNGTPGPVTVNTLASIPATGIYLIIADVSAVSTDGSPSRHHFTLSSDTGSIYQQPKYNYWDSTGNSNGVMLMGLLLAVGATTVTLSLTHDSGAGTVTVDANDATILAIQIG